MKLLLDTHIFLWSLLDPDRLSSGVASQLENQENELWLSPITSWEILLLAEKKRIELDEDAAGWLGRVFRKIPVRQAPITHEVAIRSRQVKLPHRDPADRFLAATAAVYDLILVTADERLLAAGACRTLANDQGGSR